MWYKKMGILQANFFSLPDRSMQIILKFEFEHLIFQVGGKYSRIWED